MSRLEICPTFLFTAFSFVILGLEDSRTRELPHNSIHFLCYISLPRLDNRHLGPIVQVRLSDLIVRSAGARHWLLCNNIRAALLADLLTHSRHFTGRLFRFFASTTNPNFDSSGSLLTNPSRPERPCRFKALRHFLPPSHTTFCNTQPSGSPSPSAP
jgi:hypothetical protein